MSPSLALAHLPEIWQSRRCLGIAEAVFDCSMLSTDAGARTSLLNNVVLCGGCAKIPGLQTRLMSELRSLLPASTNISPLKCVRIPCKACMVADVLHL